MTSLPPLVDTTSTRETLHRLAENVLAAEQRAAAGTIRLHVLPGGFGTGWFDGPAGRTRLRVDGAQVVRETEQGERPADRWPVTGPFDPAAAAVLCAWWRFGDEALRRVVAGPGESLSPIVLWPEHFDVAVTLTTAAGELNLGFSPGDGFCAEPYVYAGPWTQRTGEFWNAPFGAYRTYSQIGSADDPDTTVDTFVAQARAALR